MAVMLQVNDGALLFNLSVSSLIDLSQSSENDAINKKHTQKKLRDSDSRGYQWSWEQDENEIQGYCI